MEENATEIVRPAKKGRPPKAKHEKRNHIHSSAYTEEESLRLIERAAQAHIPASIFQREAALNSKIIVRNIDAGFKIGVFQEMTKQLHYCRAELHKVERSLAATDQRLPAIMALRAEVSESLQKVDNFLICLSLAFRKELGLDPD